MSFDRKTLLEEKLRKSKKITIILWIITLIALPFTIGISSVMIFYFVPLLIITLYITRVYLKYKKGYDEFRVKQTERIAERGLDKNAKLQIFGMIKAHNELRISKAAEILGINQDHIRARIYELIGEGKIEGTFPDDDTFKITSSLDEFINNLDNKFDEWEKKEKNRYNKI